MDEVMLLENFSEKYRTAVSDYYAEFSENGEDVREDVCGGPSLTFLYIRENDGRLVGMLNIRKGEEAERIGTFGYAIRPSERRKGYGSMLVESALELCEMMEIEDPVLYVNKDNVAGLRLLESLGFCETGNTDKTGANDNVIKCYKPSSSGRRWPEDCHKVAAKQTEPCDSKTDEG